MAHRLGEINREHQLHTEGTEQIRKSSRFCQVILQQQLCRIVNIHIIDTQNIQTDRRHQAGKLPHAQRIVLQAPALKEKTAA